MSFPPKIISVFSFAFIVLLVVACTSTETTSEASVPPTNTSIPPTFTPPLPTPIPTFPPLATPGPLTQFGLEWGETHKALAQANWDLLTAQLEDLPGLEKEFEVLSEKITALEVPSEAQELKTYALSLVNAQIASTKDIGKVFSQVLPAYRDYLSIWDKFLGKIDTPSVEVDRDLGSGRLLFMCNPDGNYQACLMNTDRSEKSVITASDESVMMPKMSPSGEIIVFYSNRNDITDIFVTNIDGSDEKNLTVEEGGVDPSWSPDGKQIVFASARGEGDNFQIFVMDNDGTNIMQLTDDTSSNRHPQWSPDGEKIVYFTSKSQEDGGNLLLMNVDGSNVNQLTDDKWSIGSVSWAPDGKRIIFTASEGENDSEIYIINADGSDIIQLTDNENDEVGLTWSPDGMYILYSSTFYFSTDIHIMIADGSSTTPLTDTQTEDEIISDWVP